MQNIAMGSKALVIVAITLSCSAQRPSYAGRRPIGYPQMETTTTTESALGNRFGVSGQTTTTERLPMEANGDRDLVNRLSKLPIDKQPFWLINWKALEEHRKKPVSYELRPSTFLNQNSQPERGRMDSTNIAQGRTNPMNQRRIDPINQGRMNPIGQERMNPVGQVRMDPVLQGRLSDSSRIQDLRKITISPPINRQGSVDDIPSMHDSSAMFVY